MDDPCDQPTKSFRITDGGAHSTLSNSQAGDDDDDDGLFLIWLRVVLRCKNYTRGDPDTCTGPEPHSQWIQ